MLFQFISRMNPQQTLNELLQEKGTYWLGIVQKYFTDEHVTIVGSPSIELQAKYVIYLSKFPNVYQAFLLLSKIYE